MTLSHIHAYWKINRYLYTFLMDVCLRQLNTSTPERSPHTCMAESGRLEIHWCFPQRHNLIYHETWKTWSVSSIFSVSVGWCMIWNQSTNAGIVGSWDRNLDFSGIH